MVGHVDWTVDEVEVVVAGYFAMWAEIRAGQKVVKEERYRAMASVLGRRNSKAVSRKCANVSAVLRDFGFVRWCPGLMPDGHYQRRLASAVLQWVEASADWLLFLSQGNGGRQDVEAPLTPPEAEPPPSRRDPLLQAMSDLSRSPSTRIINYVLQAERNAALGRQGEEFVVERERRWLHDVVRAPQLAKRVAWVSQSEGDGLGYDIRSFTGDGAPRLIEVKTTKFGKATPFFVTQNELAVSRREASAYELHRLFYFDREPRFYIVQGPLDESCDLEPQTFLGRVAVP